MKDVGSKPFVTNGSVIPLDICVLLRFSRLNITERYVMLTGPLNELSTDVFGAVIHAYHRGFPRHAITWSRLRVTRAADSEKSTSMARPLRLKSSKMYNVLNDFPFNS